MTTTRREFVKITALSGSALALGISYGHARERRKAWKPNTWLRIETDGTITIVVGKSEMGQGVRTALPMLVAEELDADWKAIQLEQASPGKDYTRLGTGGSFSVASNWNPLRRAGATAREMLLLAAASKWSVDRAALRTDRGVVLHEASGRRATYGELSEAAAAIPVPKDITLKQPKDFRIIGRRTARVDGPAIVTGRAKFGADIRVPGMRYAVVLRPPVPGDKLARFDGAKAKQVRGVRDVVAISTGVAIIADSTWAALKARSLVDVQSDAGPNRGFDSADYIATLEKASLGPGTVTRSDGDAPAALSGAARTFEASYVYPFYAHAAVETVNCTAHVRGKECEIWAPTQTPNGVQSAVARLLGIQPESVKVNVTLIGGGFGRKLRPDYAIEAAELSKTIQAPVQVLWTREDDIRDGLLQHASVHAMRAGVDADARLTAWSHRKATNRIMTRFDPPNPDEAKDLAIYYREASWGVYDNPYAIANLETSYAHVPSPVRYGPWRAVFSPSSTFARESFLDEIAHALRRDPMQFRLDLLRGPDTVKAGDLTIERPRLRRVLEVARDKSGWGSPLPAGRARGVACNVYDGETHVAYVAEVTTTGKTFRIDRIIAAVDCGLVVNPTGVEQQVEGGIIWALGQFKSQITIANGAVEQSNYLDYDVPRISDTPAIEIHLVDGGKQPYGIGEPPVPPLVPAVLNAWFAASGQRVRRLPL